MRFGGLNLKAFAGDALKWLEDVLSQHVFLRDYQVVHIAHTLCTLHDSDGLK
jgi:hypothetical protein